MSSETNASDVEAILTRYSESLLRKVADKLLKPRSTWPIEDVRQKCVEGLQNPILIDRRLKDLPEDCRKLLKMVKVSNQSLWRIDHLIQCLASLGHIDGIQPVLNLLESGLIFPDLTLVTNKLKAFEDWLGLSGMLLSIVWVPNSVTERCADFPLGLPNLEGISVGKTPGVVVDGWEWPLRIAAAWQKLDGTTLKVAQSGTYYKRELTKLQTDSVLNSAFAVPLVTIPEPGVLAFSWARLLGMFRTDKTEIISLGFSEIWKQDLGNLLKRCLAEMLRIVDWNPVDGYAPETGEAATPSISLLILLLLAEVKPDRAVSVDELQRFIEEKHPRCQGSTQVHAYIRGLIYGVFVQLRIVELFNRPEADLIRLSDMGRWILLGEKKPDLSPPFTQTLTVQPSGEIILFRQHLQVSLVADLSSFAVWKTIGSACTLEVDPDRLYRGLESGLTFTQIVQTLEKFGMYTLPGTVRDSIGRWANKWERVTVFASATLIEFVKPEDLEDAFRRGLVAQKLTDRIGLSEKAELDYKHFRLLANRDYEMPPQPCVEFDEDGLTFDVISTRADLLLEAELKQLAEALPFNGNFERRRYRFTLERFRKMADAGWNLEILDRWCRERSGQSVSASASLLFAPPLNLSLSAIEKLVIALPSDHIADALMQWPTTHHLIEARLGPRMLSVSAEKIGALKTELQKIGIELKREL